MLQKKGSLWYIVLNYKNESGQWRKKWIPTGTESKREAGRKEKELDYRSSIGMIQLQRSSSIPTLKEHLDKWLEVCIKPPSRAPATYENYEYICRKVCVRLGSTKIDKLTSAEIEYFLKEELVSGLSHTVVRLEYRVLNVALKAAMEWHIIMLNPMSPIKPPKPSKSPAKVLSPTDVSRLLEISKDDPILFVVVCLGALCGLRRGEIAGLRWQDVDMDHQILHIRHSMSRRENDTISEGSYPLVIHGEKSSLVLDKTKTEDSAQDIFIPSLAAESLRSIKIWQHKNRLILGRCYQNYHFVLSWEDGRPCEPNWIYQALQRQLKKAGLPHIRVHDLRHTAATLLLRQGVDIKLVSRQLRHHDVMITQNLYQHVTEELAKKSAYAMDALFQKDNSSTKTSTKR